MIGARPHTIRASWLLPVEGVPVKDAVVTIEDGRIQSIEQGSPGAAQIDFGQAAIFPGFVNAHTHLDLPALGEPVDPLVPVDQIDWLRRMILHRRGGAGEPLDTVTTRNLAACLSAGTTTVADISGDGASWNVLAASPVRGTVFHELVGLKRERGLETSARAFAWLRTAQASERALAGRLRAGLSPHAPYSTAGWLYERAATAGVPLSTHLAELPEEARLVATRDGRLRACFEELGVWDSDWEPLGSRPADYLRKGSLRTADWLVAHGTYLDASDFWQFLPTAAPDRQRVAVAYCPRSTAYFGHGPHPFKELLARGTVVCLGTDSLASSPTLSMLDEIKFLHGLDPSLPVNLLLTMATLSGAWALRAEREVGSVWPGKRADLAIVRVPNQTRRDPHDLLVEPEAHVVATLINGTVVFADGEITT